MFIETLPRTDVLLPPPIFNAIFLTYHAQAHFLEEGLRLKQLLDWAMFLKRDALIRLIGVSFILPVKISFASFR